MEFADVEAMAYPTIEEAEAAKARWETEQGCTVRIRPANGIDQAFCDLGDQVKWVVERSEDEKVTTKQTLSLAKSFIDSQGGVVTTQSGPFSEKDYGRFYTTYSPDDGGWYACRPGAADKPNDDLLTGIYPTESQAAAAARAGNWV